MIASSGPLDLANLTEAFDGDRAAIADVLGSTLDGCARNFSELRMLLAARLAPATARSAHRMKGALLTIGAAHAARLTDAIELEAKAERWSQADLAIEPLAHAFTELRAAVAAFRLNAGR